MERVLTGAVVARTLLLVCALAGCGGADDVGPAATGDVKITSTPTAAVHRGSNNFTLTLAAGALAPSSKEHTTVTVEPWMPAMGHGAPYEPTVAEVGPGKFTVEDVVFSMPGTWELRVKVTSDVGSGTNTFKYEVP